MAVSTFIVGEYQQFAEGVEAAEIHGDRISRVVNILGVRPPYRNKDEVELLSEEDHEAATDLALDASGALEVAIEVGKINRDIEVVVFSKTGALALRSSIRNIPDEVFTMIEVLDGGNVTAICDAYELDV